MVDELKINAEIKARTVRLIDQDGNMVGEVSIGKALEYAKDAELDLIEISPNANPPVCKIADYGKMRYQNQKKLSDNKKKQKAIELKEIKMSGNIGPGDYETKMKQARKFLNEGNKVRFNFKFRGREIVYSSSTSELTNKMIEELSDISKVDVAPKMEDRKLFFVLSSTIKKK